MVRKLIELRWRIYDRLRRQLTVWGLRHGYAWPYGEALLGKLRTIYYGGVPASILLLCNGMSNGHCYDRAALMARAFLDEDGDVRLIYASVASLRWNPLYADYIRDDASMSEHCFVEITETDGRKLILDTSSSFIFKVITFFSDNISGIPYSSMKQFCRFNNRCADIGIVIFFH